MKLRFSKMHGAGNDFVVTDTREWEQRLSESQLAQLCDRHRGIGCDQLMLIEPPRSAGAVLAYSIRNRDGSVAGQCGNGARCVAAWARRAGILPERGGLLDSPAGPIEVRFVEQQVELRMGRVSFDHQDVGFVAGSEPLEIVFAGQWWSFALASMGNPHALIEVDEISTAPVAELGAALQADARFADSCNVGFAEVVNMQHIKLRVFERGAGETLACGSGACAAVALLQRAGRCTSPVAVDLPGGRLRIEVDRTTGEVSMRGPYCFVFEGVMEL
ncbi:diaminopimelate epimerase [Pseudomarimonas arenosa]|uniref:Diaminopimelate epimerase n=1 Tax=Pseudomarimonas arenosa TaxID=2774145 RepID=A0AAW3ZJG4_9GAMM|nr:diaminopimelate epimerase [Pseudomarimonas arenosa]MBD8525167.1 diaminopimelate epimerase [Pseudomarimonas arenosa]